MPQIQSGTVADTPLVRAPAYRQLNERLRGLVAGGDVKPGQRFPTERELATRFGVSRVTANKALSQLVLEGLLEFRPGVGTFVRAHALDHDLGTLVSFTRKAELSGKRPATRVLAFRRLAAASLPAEVRAALGPGEDEVFSFVRLRLADDVPVILERRWMPVAACPGLTRRSAAGSLYALLRELGGPPVTGSEQTIRAVSLTAADAAELGVAAGSAALLIHAVGHSADGPLWVEDTLYRGDRYCFQNSISGVRTARPARVAEFGAVPGGGVSE